MGTDTELEKGTLVRHTKRLEWGIGVILLANADGRVEIEFGKHGRTKLLLSAAGEHLEIVHPVTKGAPPQEIMKPVLWQFSGKKVPSITKFRDAVASYHQKMAPDQEIWEPDDVVLARPVVRIRYQCWKRGLQQEPMLMLFADNDESFTAAELLWKIHNSVISDLARAEVNFFQGLTLRSFGEPHTPPLYGMLQGS